MNSEYKDPRWQRIRLMVMERDKWKCVACGGSDETLNVHHIAYSGHVWDSAMEDMQTLCHRCHAQLGKHPKGGAYYTHEVVMVDTDQFETYLAVAYRHCPCCGERGTECHSACVIFKCKCEFPGIPEWLCHSYEYQGKTESGNEAYFCHIAQRGQDNDQSH